MKAHIVGGGISSLSAAAFLIRDGGLSGGDIHIYEAGKLLGGALDASGSAETGYMMRGGRMFEAQDRCMHDLLSFIPSASDPAKSIDDDIREFSAAHGWHNKARLVGAGGKIVDAEKFGLSTRNKLDLAALTLKPEALLEGKMIDDCLDLSILETNFWSMFGSIFAFMPWHSAIEMRRYLLRFIHLLPEMDTMTSIQHTRFNQYEAIVKPLTGWLAENGVSFHMGARVDDIDFKPSETQTTVSRLRLMENGRERGVEVAPSDLVFVTNGSHVAAASFGSITSPPPAVAAPQEASWRLWERLARKRAGFGRPAVFNSDTGKSAWITFTLTFRGSRFTDLMETLTGSKEGRGGLVTLKDSSWLLTIVSLHNPHFADQPEDVHVWWGYGLYLDRPGNFVAKPMTECSGGEILEEVIRHLGLEDHLDSILESAICIPCLLPYAGSCLLLRRKGDRPEVIPPRSTNFAFIGQFTEIPDEVVFTTEYAARSARTAVALLLKIDMPPPVYKGQYNPGVLFRAARSLNT